MKRRNGTGSPTPEGAGPDTALPATDEPVPPPPEAAPETTLREISGDLAGESSDTLTLYLRDVRRTTLFTAQEEFETATRARAGDFAARQSMIEHNLRLVVSIAKVKGGEAGATASATIAIRDNDAQWQTPPGAK